MKKTLLDFVVDQWSTVPPVESMDLSGKTVVIVGANAGIGFEAATHFARMTPAKLILGCRSESKGQSAVSGAFLRYTHFLLILIPFRHRKGDWIQIVRVVED